MFSTRANSLITFLLLYTLLGMILMSMAGVAYFTREATGRTSVDADPAEAAKIRQRANRWAVAGLFHVGFSLWAYDRATRACPLEPGRPDEEAVQRTTRLATVTGAVGLVGALAAALVLDFTPILAQ